jgi:hypothetical protein
LLLEKKGALAASGALRIRRILPERTIQEIHVHGSLALALYFQLRGDLHFRKPPIRS